MTMGQPVRAGVIGWPVSHSLSPVMMTAWLEAAELAGRYERLAIAPEDFEARVRTLAADGFSGVNITLPHKQAALALADEVSAAARAVGAANVLTLRGGKFLADNTDVIGIRAALNDAGWNGGGPAVLIGAGGAARAGLHVLSRAGVEDIRIVNRTPSRAAEMAASMGIRAEVFAMDDIAEALGGARLLINATSMGMAGRPELAPDLPGLAPGAIVFDMVYVPLETPLLKAAKAAGLRTADGLSMLIGQARPAFEAFFGAPPPADVDVRALMEAALEANR